MLHNYHAMLGCFPPGYISAVGSNGVADDQGPGWGWAAMVLPYLEQQNLHSQIHFDKDIKDATNATVRLTSLSVFLCASDDGSQTFKVDSLNDSTPDYSVPVTDSSGNPVIVGHSNYVGVFGQPEITPDPGYLLPAPDRSVAHQGMFYRNAVVRIADVTDGTSNTLFVGERCTKFSYATWTGAVTGGQVPPVISDVYANDPAGACCLVLGQTGTRQMCHPTPPTASRKISMMWVPVFTRRVLIFCSLMVR